MMYLLTAAVVPSPVPIDPEAIIGNALTIGSTLPGIAGAIFVGLVVVAWAALKIAKYFEARGKREEDAFLEDQRVRNQQAENTARMQADAVVALLDNMDISYKQDYNYCVDVIKQKKYYAVYAKFSPQFKEQLAAFIYDEKATPEFRAARVIQVVRKI